MATPALQFGRNWFVELQIGSEKGLKSLVSEPFQFSVELQKEVDPLSGMTVNLQSVDRAWAEVQDLKNQAWNDPLDFLKAVANRWQAWIAGERAQLLRIKIENLSGTACEVTGTGFFFKTVARFQTADVKMQAAKKVLLTSRKPWTGEERLEILEAAQTLNRETLTQLFFEYPFLSRIEIFDTFEKFVEWDLRP